MKKLLCVAALLVLASAPAMAAKVCLCHVDDDGAHYILVSGNGQAVDRHLDKHGDCVEDIDLATCEELEDAEEVCDPTDALDASGNATPDGICDESQVG